jgi:hypothetical protein
VQPPIIVSDGGRGAQQLFSHRKLNSGFAINGLLPQIWPNPDSWMKNGTNQFASANRPGRVFLKAKPEEIRGDRKAGGFGGATPNNSIRRGPRSTATRQPQKTE